MEPKPIDENTPRDRPILVLAPTDDKEFWPGGVQSAVAQWYGNIMRKYIENNRREGDTHIYDFSKWDYWAYIDPPQGSIDVNLAFEPTHWCEIPVLP